MLDPHVVIVERPLQQELGALGDRDIVGQGLVERDLADRLAHGAFADLGQRVLDVSYLEQQFERIGLDVLHRRFDLDQIGVRRQHAGVVDHAVLVRHVDDDFALDRPGQVPVVAGTGGLQILAEAQYHGALLRVDAVQAAADPHGADQHQDAAQARAEVAGALSAAAAGPAPAAPEQRRQAALEIAQHIVQIVLRLLRPVPGIAFLAARFVPSHT